MSGAFDDFWLQAQPRLNSSLGGETVTLRRESMVEGGGVIVSSLEVAAAAAAGAGALALRRVGGGGKVKGRILAGTTLTVGANTYVAQADVEDVLSVYTVPVLPVLAAPVSVGDLVTIGPAVFTFLDAHVTSVTEEDAGGDQGGELGLRISLPKLGAPTTPRIQDRVTRANGQALRLASIPDDRAGSWEVTLGVVG